MSLSPRSPRALLIGSGVILSLAAFVGCNSSSSTEPPSVVTMELTIVSPVTVPIALRVGDAVSLSTNITMSDGSAPVGLPTIQWLSRSVAVASVAPGGVVRGVTPGQGYIVAELDTTLGTVRDSVRVVVSPAETPQ